MSWDWHDAMPDVIACACNLLLLNLRKIVRRSTSDSQGLQIVLACIALGSDLPDVSSLSMGLRYSLKIGIGLNLDTSNCAWIMEEKSGWVDGKVDSCGGVRCHWELLSFVTGALLT